MDMCVWVGGNKIQNTGGGGGGGGGGGQSLPPNVLSKKTT
jgi:hypothetical protein